jgi:hypothetical protein
MRINANDVRSRVTLARFLVRIDRNPEYSKEIGVENTSRFRTEAVLKKKEENENAEFIHCHSVCDHFV